jgi:hypothetical protein
MAGAGTREPTPRICAKRSKLRGDEPEEEAPLRKCINGPQNGGTCRNMINSWWPARCKRCKESPFDALLMR